MKRNIVIFSALTALLSSCAISIPNSNFSVSDQHIDTEGYRVVKKVKGSASTPYILNMIGGFGGVSLIEKAREKAIQNANLQPGQSLAFETINDKMTNYIILGIRTTTFSAYVIEKGDGQGFAASAMANIETVSNEDPTFKSGMKEAANDVKAEGKEIKKEVKQDAKEVKEVAEEKVQVASEDLKNYRTLIGNFFSENKVYYSAEEFWVKKRSSKQDVVLTNGKVDVHLIETDGLWSASSRINKTKYSSDNLTF